MYPPPSVRESSPGAIVRSKRLKRRLPPYVSTCFAARICVSPTSTSNVFVLKISPIGTPVGSTADEVRRLAVEHVHERLELEGVLREGELAVAHRRPGLDVERTDAGVHDAVGAADAARRTAACARRPESRSRPGRRTSAGSCPDSSTADTASCRRSGRGRSAARTHRTSTCRPRTCRTSGRSRPARAAAHVEQGARRRAVVVDLAVEDAAAERHRCAGHSRAATW